jgi:hypothetical protein
MFDTSHIEDPCVHEYTSLDVPSQDFNSQPQALEQAELEAEKYIAKPELVELPPGFYFENKSLMWCELHNDARKTKAPEFICSKLEVLAITRDKEGNNHGRLLECQGKVEMSYSGKIEMSYRSRNKQ